MPSARSPIRSSSQNVTESHGTSRRMAARNSVGNGSSPSIDPVSATNRPTRSRSPASRRCISYQKIRRTSHGLNPPKRRTWSDIREGGQGMIRSFRRPLLACAVLAAALAAPGVARADVIRDWNLIAQQQTIPLRPTAHGESRGMAMVEGAVYDAVNAIDGGSPALSPRPSGDRRTAVVLAGRGGGHRGARRARRDRAGTAGDDRRPLRIATLAGITDAFKAQGARSGPPRPGDARVPPERRVPGAVRLRARDRSRRRRLAAASRRRRTTPTPGSATRSRSSSRARRSSARTGRTRSRATRTRRTSTRSRSSARSTARREPRTRRTPRSSGSSRRSRSGTASPATSRRRRPRHGRAGSPLRDDQPRRGRRRDRLLERQVLLELLAADRRDPRGRHRRQPGDRSPTRPGSRCSTRRRRRRRRS